MVIVVDFLCSSKESVPIQLGPGGAPKRVIGLVFFGVKMGWVLNGLSLWLDLDWTGGIQSPLFVLKGRATTRNFAPYGQGV
ncbi:hypothetical protein GDO81_020071 [Engystomops pustulosus]|uniref:Uncharacterized protein n=1 Tax=Engystomops pustulosus TaxID=76066 RepID=A0AAV6ZEV9_ENGPU|nr:hypothetical protein GDO81_020071 [Engystomops pustulosus]